MKALFLFGAGASANSGECYPNKPPLGANLFQQMEKEGLVPSSIDNALKKKFINNFEEGMYLLNEHGSLAYNPFQRNLAKFFAKFNPGESNFYRRLLIGLKNKNALWKTTFSTLNYDCLIERSTSGLSIPFRYCGRNLLEVSDQLPILKIHGSCGFLPDTGSVVLDNIYFDGRSKSDVDAQVKETCIEKEITDWCNNPANNSLSPAISMYMRGKRNPYCSSYIEKHYKFWKSALDDCVQCFIIGVKFNEQDTRIWQPILNANCKLSYIDPQPDDFTAWAKKNNRQNVEHYSDTFENALNSMINDIVKM